MSEKSINFERLSFLEEEEEEMKSWIDLQKAFLTEEDIKGEEDDICR